MASSFIKIPKIEDTDQPQDIFQKIEPLLEGYLSAGCLKYGITNELDDVVSFVRVRLYEKILKFVEKEERKPAYLRYSIQTAFIDYLREEKTRSVDIREATASSGLLRFVAEGPSFEERREALLDACEDGKDRILLAMTLNGDSRKEISDFLGITQRDVRERAKRLMGSVDIEDGGIAREEYYFIGEYYGFEPDSEEVLGETLSSEDVIGMKRTGYSLEEVIKALGIRDTEKGRNLAKRVEVLYHERE